MSGAGPGRREGPTGPPKAPKLASYSRIRSARMARGSATSLDLFAGAGGLTLGFVSEGVNPLLAVEWELPAAATYAANS
jgi:16S rRNA G966 N2-methylase RsmD